MMPTHSLASKTDYPNRAALLRLKLRMAEEAQLVGGRIRERREELDLTQRELAEMLPGKTEGKDISRYERGEHLPGSDTRAALAEVLGISLADLVSGPIAGRRNGALPAADTGPEYGYRRVDVERAIRMESKLDALLAHFKLEWLDPDAALPGSTAGLEGAKKAAQKAVPKKQAARSRSNRRSS